MLWDNTVENTPDKFRNALRECEHLGKDCLFSRLGPPRSVGKDGATEIMEWRGGRWVQEYDGLSQEWEHSWYDCEFLVNIMDNSITAWSSSGECR